MMLIMHVDLPLFPMLQCKVCLSATIYMSMNEEHVRHQSILLYPATLLQDTHARARDTHSLNEI